MSLAEVMPYQDEAPRGSDRTPPQDMNAEQCVLGAMLMSKDAIADVVEVLRGNDFYRPAHEQVYEAIIDLYGRGEPADAVTVSDLLSKRGELMRLGGAPYLHTLLASVPIAANAGWYAEIVREKAILRRLVDASIRIGQMSYAGEGAVDEIVDRAQAEVYSVTERRASEDYKPLSELMQPTLDEMEAISSRGGGLSGVPTGFADLDELTNGLHPGQMVIVAARPGMGKALALDTELPTPTGWTTMGQVHVGDLMLGSDGRPTRVTAATDVFTARECYQLTFSDGTTVVADGEHQWRATTRASRRAAMERRPPSYYFDTQAIERLRRMRDAAAVEPEVYRTMADLVALVGPEFRHVLHAVGREVGPAVRVLAPAGGSLAQASRTVVYPGTRMLDVLSDRVSRPRSSWLATEHHAVATTVDLAASVRLGDGRANWAVDVAGPLELDDADLPLDPYDRDTARGDSRDQLRAPHYIVAVDPVPSVPVRCVQVDNDDHTYLVTRAMIPTHNSTLALDLARSASIKNGLTSCIFSLEMSQIEITMRLLSAEASIPLNHIRNGRMSDDDWQRVAQKMGQVSEAPLYIDDSPNLTMMEIRAKARRLRQRHDLRLVVIDYIQLMTSGKKVESRQLEVSEFSRQLKLLAKELEVPVVALSQLNRGPEQRTDKKPMLSDLRESGCLTADTRLVRADTGAEVSMGELLASDTRNIPVWSLDDHHRLVARTMTHVFPSGVKEVFRLRLASGREVKATANHPFLTYSGWTALGDLAPGSQVAVPRRLPAPISERGWDPDEVVLLAHLLGDGSFVRNQPIRYASVDEANLSAVAGAAERRFGITGKRDEYPAARVTTLRLPAPFHLTHGKRNPIAAWLDNLGLFGLRSWQKFIPEGIFGQPLLQVQEFIRHLWATDGSVRWNARQGLGSVYYASTSRRLIDDLARLLLRCDIVARIKTVPKAGYRDCYHLVIYGAENQLRFCREIGVHGLRGDKAREVADQLASVKINTNLDTIPREVWTQVRSTLVEREMTHREFAAAMQTQFCGSTLWKHAPSRPRLARIAAVLESPELTDHATNDVFWDAVVAIDSLGEQDVFDATVLGTHNFIADGITVHNSLEQDADMVILLNRPDIHDKESDRAGEADIDVAKHRNGPTKTLTVAFQGHYSRFTDMQH